MPDLSDASGASSAIGEAGPLAAMVFVLLLVAALVAYLVPKALDTGKSLADAVKQHSEAQVETAKINASAMSAFATCIEKLERRFEKHDRASELRHERLVNTMKRERRPNVEST